MEKVILEMTPATARIVNAALEFYARGMFGQFDYCIDTVADGIPWDRLPPHGDAQFGHEFDEWLERRETANSYARLAKSALFPELVSNQYYGVGKCRQADIAWQVYEVLRYTMSWHEHPEGGITVNFDKPMTWSDEPLPECRIEEA